MTRIETQPLNLRPDVVPLANLTDRQRLYLDLFRQGRTITQTVDHFLQEGRLVSFSELYELVHELAKSGCIQNAQVLAYFNKIRDLQKAKVEKRKGLSGLFGGKKEDAETLLKKHPFFRSQNAVVTALFARHAEVIEVKAGTLLCQTGNLERDLYFMIDGEVAVYKNSEERGRKLLGFFGKDAVVGEVGFFMGELRTADVVCTKPSKLVVVRYDEAAFGRIINKDIARNLQVRFRVVHALAKSPFLKSIPEEALDCLLFAGKIRQAKEFDILTKEGEHGDSCFIVVSGSVVISRGTKNINVLGPGEAFGEIALFFTQGRRTATAMSQRDSLLIEIPARDFYRILGENLLLACEFEKLAVTRARQLQAA